jgi:DNA polymerase iota
MDYDTNSNRSDTSVASLSGSESEIEPSPKKTRFGLLIAKRRCLSNASHGSMEDISSPSKLKVADLRLNSKEFDREWSSPKNGASCSTALPTTPTTSHHHKLFHQLVKKNIATATSQLNQQQSTSSSSSSSLVDSSKLIPSDVDPNVFKELPLDVQKELISSWRATVTTTTSATLAKPNMQKTTANGNNNNSNSKKKNTLHRYFIRNE